MINKSELERCRHYWVLYSPKGGTLNECIRAHLAWFTDFEGNEIPLETIECLVPIPDSSHMEEIMDFISELASDSCDRIASKAQELMEGMPWKVLRKS